MKKSKLKNGVKRIIYEFCTLNIILQAITVYFFIFNQYKFDIFAIKLLTVI